MQIARLNHNDNLFHGHEDGHKDCHKDGNKDGARSKRTDRRKKTARQTPKGPPVGAGHAPTKSLTAECSLLQPALPSRAHRASSEVPASTRPSTEGAPTRRRASRQEYMREYYVRNHGGAKKRASEQAVQEVS